MVRSVTEHEMPAQLNSGAKPRSTRLGGVAEREMPMWIHRFAGYFTAGVNGWGGRLDRAIAVIAPVWALRRAQARAALTALDRSPAPPIRDIRRGGPMPWLPAAAPFDRWARVDDSAAGKSGYAAHRESKA
jgi:hypothetical protein